jgi:hypothetical protein
VTMRMDDPVSPVKTGFTIVAVGLLVALVTVLSLALVRPVLLGFALGALVLLIPPLVMRDPKAYWLFLLVLSIPFDISKRATTWLVQPWDLYRDYGMPASGTLSLDFYLTDIVLFVLLVSWLVRLCLRRDNFFFPNVAYIYVLYLAWTLITSLLQSQSLYLSMFEWCRQFLYFVAFLYLVHNVVTRSQFRAVVGALFIGLTVASGTVIAFFTLEVGTETFAFSGLYSEHAETSKSSQGTLYVSGKGGDDQTKRSAGFFTHPAHAAYYLEYILTIVLAYLIVPGRTRDRLVLGALFMIGLVALYMTFARSAVVGLFCGFVAVIAIAGWSGMISRRVIARCALVFAVCIAIGAPVLIHYLANRPDPITKRLELIEIALNTFWKRPVVGAGLNNSSIVTEGAESIVTTSQGRERVVTVIHNHYLIVLIEVGLVGFLLYFTFFWQVVAIALRHARVAATELKPLLVGIVGAMVSIAINNLGEPFGGHVVQAMLWLYAGLAIAACRQGDLTLPSPTCAATSRLQTQRVVNGSRNSGSLDRSSV